MKNLMHLPRRTAEFGAGVVVAAMILAGGAGAQTKAPKPEKTNITLGLPVPATTFLPIYIGADRTWKDQGLDVKVVTFRGDAGVSQALAGGSVDMSCQSPDGLISLLQSKQPVIGFWAGFDQADFAWFAKPSIKTWADLKGKTIGVSTYGSLTDQLTRAVLLKHGLDPKKDVRIIQAGPSMASYHALKSGRLDAAILSVPTKLMAEDAGLTRLGTQAKELAPHWPKHVCIAPKAFIAANPNTIKAFIRGLVKAEQIAKKQPNYAIHVLEKQLKYEPDYAKRAYEEAIGGFDTSGELPNKAIMKTFWRVTVASGKVKKVIPTSQLLDRQFIDEMKTSKASQ